ncbi:potassium channel family protein [Shimia sp. W99]|uniref:Ion channel n=1 Tax=Shimia aestuarii TaxID=254406 RepID=A0A1I4JJ46_9RHOB|nr:potassium channel family protein [Shimia aestuarii]SFL66126.1 Ion channel [Shimia aestuarii]
MGQIDQLFWGSVLLGICAVIHVGMLSLSIRLLERLGVALEERLPSLRVSIIVLFAFGMIVLSHTIHVWIWAGTLMRMGAITYWFDAIYFSLVTYTTVGYGDIVLPIAFRVFGAFGGVTGILCFGVSTAFLVALLGRLLPRSLTGLKRD